MAQDIGSDVGKTDERTGASEARSKDPPRWRDDEATCPADVDLLLRAVHRPLPPTPNDWIKLSMRLSAILRRPTGGTVNDEARPSEQRLKDLRSTHAKRIADRDCASATAGRCPPLGSFGTGAGTRVNDVN